MSDLVPRASGDDGDGEHGVRAFVASGGRVVGGIAGAAVGLIGGPPGALAGGAVGVALGDLLAKAGVEFYNRVLAPRQGVRAAGALAVATVEINRRLQAGEVPRQDFIETPDENSDAAEILEGTLLTAANSYEQRKVPYIGKFYANLAFDEGVTPAYASLLLKLLDRLTYGQLRVIATLGKQAYHEALFQLAAERQTGTFLSSADVIAEFDELSTMGLVGVAQEDGTAVPPLATFGRGVWGEVGLFRARLTASGVLVHDLLGLSDMPDEERDAVVRALRGEPEPVVQTEW
jgi:hypothetical protein